VADRSRWLQLTPEYLALNPNKKMPTLEDVKLLKEVRVRGFLSSLIIIAAASSDECGSGPDDQLTNAALAA